MINHDKTWVRPVYVDQVRVAENARKASAAAAGAKSRTRSARIVEAFAAGESIESIAREWDCSTNAIRTALRRAGVSAESRRRGVPSSDPIPHHLLCWPVFCSVLTDYAIGQVREDRKWH